MGAHSIFAASRNVKHLPIKVTLIALFSYLRIVPPQLLRVR